MEFNADLMREDHLFHTWIWMIRSLSRSIIVKNEVLGWVTLSAGSHR